LFEYWLQQLRHVWAGDLLNPFESVFDRYLPIRLKMLNAICHIASPSLATFAGHYFAKKRQQSCLPGHRRLLFVLLQPRLSPAASPPATGSYYAPKKSTDGAYESVVAAAKPGGRSDADHVDVLRPRHRKSALFFSDIFAHAHACDIVALDAALDSTFN
jgi:hypothetical protein